MTQQARTEEAILIAEAIAERLAEIDGIINQAKYNADMATDADISTLVAIDKYLVRIEELASDAGARFVPEQRGGESMKSETARTIKEIRATTGLSQAAFAEAYDIPKRTIENWEAGTNEPPAYMVAFLQRATRDSITIEKAGNYWTLIIKGLEVSTGDLVDIAEMVAEDAAKIEADPYGYIREQTTYG